MTGGMPAVTTMAARLAPGTATRSYMKHKHAPRAIPPTARIARGEHEQSGSVGRLDRSSEAQASSLAGEE